MKINHLTLILLSLILSNLIKSNIANYQTFCIHNPDDTLKITLTKQKEIIIKLPNNYEPENQIMLIKDENSKNDAIVLDGDDSFDFILLYNKNKAIWELHRKAIRFIHKLKPEYKLKLRQEKTNKIYNLKIEIMP
jgi:hypothetical protein